MTEMPPSTPNTGLRVFLASSTPAGIEMVISQPRLLPVISSRTCRMSFLGPGLMEGSPMGTVSPGLVTVPTPMPALKTSS